MPDRLICLLGTVNVAKNYQCLNDDHNHHHHHHFVCFETTFLQPIGRTLVTTTSFGLLASICFATTFQILCVFNCSTLSFLFPLLSLRSPPSLFHSQIYFVSRLAWCLFFVLSFGSLFNIRIVLGCNIHNASAPLTTINQRPPRSPVWLVSIPSSKQFWKHSFVQQIIFTYVRHRKCKLFLLISHRSFRTQYLRFRIDSAIFCLSRNCLIFVHFLKIFLNQ